MHVRNKVLDDFVSTKKGRFVFFFLFIFLCLNGHYLLFGCTGSEALSGNIWSISLVRRALSMSFNSAMRKAGLNTADTTIPAQNHVPSIDIYYPISNHHQKEKKGPGCIYFHGGAFLFGSKEFGAPPLTYLAAHGVTGFSVGYRLASLASSPGLSAAVEDARNAMAFIKENAAHYGVDPQKIFVMGDSAGGLLATLLAIDHNSSAAALIINWPLSTLSGQQWFGNSQQSNIPNVFVPQSINNKAQFIDTHVFAGNFLLFGRRFRGWLPPRYDSHLAHLYSPMSRLNQSTLQKLPPALISAAFNDTIVPYEQTKLFAQTYHLKSQSSTLITFYDSDHCQGAAYASPIGRATLTAFLRKHRLLGTDSPHKNTSLLNAKLDQFIKLQPSPASGPCPVVFPATSSNQVVNAAQTPGVEVYVKGIVESALGDHDSKRASIEISSL